MKKYRITAIVRVWIKEEYQVEALKKFLQLFPEESEIRFQDVLPWNEEQ